MPKYLKAKAAADSAKTAALAAQLNAEQVGFKDASLNTAASASIESWLKLRAKESSAKKKIKNKPFNLIPSLLALMVGFGLFFSIGMRFIDGDAKTFLKGF
ncbi:putative sulfate exporter family transporter, partial [Aduncisulcus paluster]